MDDVQIICIDDCSTDRSPFILNAYSMKDTRVQYLRTSINSGPAVARNLGLEKASGDFIVMVDSDDWLSLDALENAYEIAIRKNSDGVLLKLCFFDQFTSEERFFQNIDYIADREPSSSISGLDAFYLSLEWRIHGLALWRTDILRKIKYDEAGINGDEYTTRLLFLSSQIISFCDGIYYYRKHSESLTTVFSLKRFEVLETSARLSELLHKLPSTKERRVCYGFYQLRIITGCLDLFWKNLPSLDSNERKMVINYILNNSINNINPDLRWRSIFQFLIKRPIHFIFVFVSLAIFRALAIFKNRISYN